MCDSAAKPPDFNATEYVKISAFMRVNRVYITDNRCRLNSLIKICIVYAFQRIVFGFDRFFELVVVTVRISYYRVPQSSIRSHILAMDSKRSACRKILTLCFELPKCD